MKPLIRWIGRVGSALPLSAIVALIIAINAQWILTLQALGKKFEQSAGVPVLDLQNVEGVLSPGAAQALITQYSDADVALYWTFFAMDNVVPLLSFGTYALLWAYLLSRSRWSISRRLEKSWFVLIPLGVGAFDIVENLFFVSALAADDENSQLLLLAWGLTFVQAKAAMLFATFFLTVTLIALSIIEQVRRLVGRTAKRRLQPDPSDAPGVQTTHA